MPAPPPITGFPPIIPSTARDMLLNGLMQSDLDANGFRILNLDTSNLFAPGGGPNTLAAVPHFWVNSYNAGTFNFGTARPATLDLSDWPLLTGQAGKVLGTDGATIFWTPQTSGGAAGNGFINVKDPPYNAAGDGVTDDKTAIQNAINDAAGRTVYFPKGTYLLSNSLFAATVPSSFLGDGSKISVLKAGAAFGACLVIAAPHSSIQGLGFDGNISAYVQNQGLSTGTLYITSAGCVTVRDCRVSDVSGRGIGVINSENLVIEDCEIENCCLSGLVVMGSPRARIARVKIIGATGFGIRLTNSPYSSIIQCHIARCGLNSPSIRALDSDYTVIVGNNVTQGTYGIVCEISSGRLLDACGYTVSGNNVFRNYVAGIRFTLANAFECSGNNVADNCQGGFDGATYTIEPGLGVNPLFPGSGYQVGDILTLVGGTGTPAKAIVTHIGAGGALSSVDYVHAMTMGSYTVLPPESCAVTGGHGTGAQIAFSGSIMASPGSGYSPGEVLVASNGTFINPVRVKISSIAAGGAAASYEIMDGGGYTGTLPATLTFNSESVGDGQVVGSGFTLTPRWCRAFSGPFLGVIPFGIGTYGVCAAGIISGNQVSNNKLAVGILIQDAAAPYNGRAPYIWAAGNSLGNNAHSIAGDTVGSPIDSGLGLGTISSPNIVFPPGT